MNTNSSILSTEERTHQRVECYKVLIFIQQSIPIDSNSVQLTTEAVAAATSLSTRKVELALLRLMVPNASSLFPNERHIDCTRSGVVLRISLVESSALSI
jgi:hypothetical protein